MVKVVVLAITDNEGPKRIKYIFEWDRTDKKVGALCTYTVQFRKTGQWKPDWNSKRVQEIHVWISLLSILRLQLLSAIVCKCQ